MQTKEQLQSVSIPAAWTPYMLQRVEAWEKEDVHTSGTHAVQMKDDLRKLEAKIDALVDLHLNGDIEREMYLRKKDILMRQKASLQAKSSSAKHERKNWVEPLRKWILDSKRSGFLASSTNYAEIREFVRSFGTNPSMKDKTISISFSPPSQFARTRLAGLAPAETAAPQAREIFSLSAGEVSICDPTGNRTPVSTLRRSRPSR